MSFSDEFTDYDLPDFERGVRLPEINIPIEQKNHLGLKSDVSNKDFLKALCWRACKDKIRSGEIKQSESVCIDRLRMEFEVFEKTGVIDYLLLLKDIFGWCHNNGIQHSPVHEDIMTGPGRGSAAGSFSLYLTGLTSVNPFHHNLNFTRFLSEARAKPKWIDGVMYADGKTMADFDGDISFLGRPKAIQRLEKDYAGKTCKISTIQYLTGKMALKDTLKVYLGYHEGEAKLLSDHIETVFGKVDSLDKTYGKKKEFKAWADANQHTYRVAQAIEGLIRTQGIHASGMLVSYYNIIDLMPMQLSSDGEIVSAYDMDTALTVFVKADLLGLRTLDVIEECLKQIGKKISDIDIHDPSIYQFLSESENYYGLFQIEDGLTKQVTRRVKPKNIDQLAACLSISRPGALKYIDDYVKFVQTGEFKKIHPAIDGILVQTGGLILYQEQINTICQQVYGMSAIDADEVRRAIGKKLKDDMAIWEPVLYKQGKELKIPDEVTKWFWDTCNASADYLFNANHCYAYSYITCFTAYLKANHPLEFYLGCLKMSRHETKPRECINKIQNEMRRVGFCLKAPDIYKSLDDYAIFDKSIMTGLSGIKGVEEKTLEKLRRFKTDNANKFEIFESAQMAKVPINIMTALIMSGCMETKGLTRARLVLELEVYNLLTEREKPIIHKLGPQYNYDLCKIIKECALTLKDDKGKPLIKESRLATLRRDYVDYWEKYLRNIKNEELCSYVMECEYLGFSYSTSLKTIFSKDCNDLLTIEEVAGELDKTHIRVAAIVTAAERRVSKAKKKPYLYLTLQDETGELTGMLFGEDEIEEMKQFNNKDVAKNDLVIVNGKKSGDVVFLDGFSIQENPIITKKGQLKRGSGSA